LDNKLLDIIDARCNHEVHWIKLVLRFVSLQTFILTVLTSRTVLPGVLSVTSKLTGFYFIEYVLSNSMEKGPD